MISQAPELAHRIETITDRLPAGWTFPQAWREVQYFAGYERANGRRFIPHCERNEALLILEGWIEGHNRDMLTPFREVEWIEQEYIERRDLHDRIEKLRSERNSVGDTQPAPTSPSVPLNLIRPPGLLEYMVDWINDTAPRAQPALAFANAVAFLGAVLGRRVQTATGLRTNLYMIGLSPSGSGKDHSRGCVKKMAAAAGLMRLLGGEDLTSDAAILAATHRNPSLLFQIDEVGHFINSAMNIRAAAYAKTIPKTFTQLFSSADSVYQGKEYAGGKDREDITQPNVCLYGTSVPGRMWEGITATEIEDGFLPRIMIVPGEDRPARRKCRPYPPPEIIVEQLKWWSSFPHEGNLGGVHTASLEPDIVTVEMDDRADKLLDQAFDRWEVEADKSDSAIRAIWNRAGEHASKLALIYACSRSPKKLQIIGKDAGLAIALVDYLSRSLIEQISDYVASSEFGREAQKLFRAIKNKPGISLTELSRTTRGMNLKTRRDALADLEQQGRVISQAEPTSGRPVVRYRVYE